MGNEHSGISEGRLYNEEEYVVVRQTNDVRYGDVKILRHKITNYLVCEQTKIITSEQAFEKKIKQSQFRRELTNDHLVKLINFTASKKEEFCSSFWKIQLLYEYVQFDLKQAIQKRLDAGLHFSEGQLWYVLKSCLDALLYLKNKSVYHQDIKPYNILVSQTGEIKLSENFQGTRPQSAYQQILLGQSDEFYLSPQLFAQLKEQKPDPVYDIPKNDIFSLGLSLLEAATLRTSIQCYDTDNFAFRQEVLQQLFGQVPEGYSSRFVTFLQTMLQLEEQQRPSLEELAAQVELYSQEAWWQVEVPRYLDTFFELDTLQQAAPSQQQQDVGQQSEVSAPAPGLSIHASPTYGSSGEAPVQQRSVNQGYASTFSQQEQDATRGQQSLGSDYLTNIQTPAFSGSTAGGLPPASATGTGAYVPYQFDKDRFVYTTNLQSTITGNAGTGGVGGAAAGTNTTTTTAQFKDLDDLEARINAVLAQSRETVLKYGGQRGIETYEKSAGYTILSSTAALNYGTTAYTPAVLTSGGGLQSTQYYQPSTYYLQAQQQAQPQAQSQAQPQAQTQAPAADRTSTATSKDALTYARDEKSEYAFTNYNPSYVTLNYRLPPYTNNAPTVSVTTPTSPNTTGSIAAAVAAQQQQQQVVSTSGTTAPVSDAQYRAEQAQIVDVKAPEFKRSQNWGGIGAAPVTTSGNYSTGNPPAGVTAATTTTVDYYITPGAGGIGSFQVAPVQQDQTQVQSILQDYEWREKLGLTGTLPERSEAVPNATAAGAVVGDPSRSPTRTQQVTASTKQLSDKSVRLNSPDQDATRVSSATKYSTNQLDDGNKPNRNLSDRDLDEQIKRSLKRSKEINEIIQSTRKALQQGE